PIAKTDCMYPSWFKESLFYIERADSQQSPCQYRIIEQRLSDIEQQDMPQICVDFDSRPLVFLTMISADEGFFLEHASKIDMAESTITFLYHQFVRHDKNSWHTRHLFSFSIPSTLLDNASDTHVYESIIP